MKSFTGKFIAMALAMPCLCLVECTAANGCFGMVCAKGAIEVAGIYATYQKCIKVGGPIGKKFASVQLIQSLANGFINVRVLWLMQSNKVLRIIAVS